ncbi:hypothetical protein CGH65_23720, partial [Vibrio parahaemolyticus]
LRTRRSEVRILQDAPLIKKPRLCEAFFVYEKQTLTTYSLVCAVKVGFFSYLIELQCHFAYLVNHL